MPCTKCEEGNYKWGKTGECKYDTLESCESANSKYNKMRPTPLGKKSYEEYAKELKEYNLSSDDNYTKLAKMINLADIKTLEQLMGKMKGSSAKMQKGISAVKKEKIATDKIGKQYDEMEVQLEKIKEQQIKVGNTFEKAMDKWDEIRKKLAGNMDDAVAFYDKLEKEAKTIEEAAKQLGIDKIPVVSSAKKALATFEKYYNEANKVYLDMPKN